MGELKLEGSPVWFFVLAAGCLLLYFRYRRAVGEHAKSKVWPPLLAEGLALALLTAMLVKPVWVRETLRFQAPEIWLAVDQSRSFQRGKTLGMGGAVDSSVDHYRAAAESLGYRTRAWDYAATAALRNGDETVSDDSSHIGALAEAVALSGRNIRAVVLFGDGRETPPQTLRELRFPTPLYAVVPALGSLRDVQASRTEWVLNEQGSPAALVVAWQRLGEPARAATFCLHAAGDSLGCWEKPADTLRAAWSEQEDTLRFTSAQSKALSPGKNLRLSARPDPPGGFASNDTLILDAPGHFQGMKLCWPGRVNSLDETMAIRLFAKDTAFHVLANTGPSCPEGIAVTRFGQKRLSPDSSAGNLILSIPGAAAGTRPAGWAYYPAGSDLHYSPAGLNRLPAGWGRIADLTPDGMWLPPVKDFQECFLAAEPKHPSFPGCLLGAYEKEDGRTSVFLALPESWATLFNEAGDIARQQRLAGLFHAAGELAGRASVPGRADAGAASPEAEMKGLGVDRLGLAALARQSHGGLLPPYGHAHDTLAGKLPWLKAAEADVGEPSIRRWGLEFSPVWFALALALLAGAWIWRKRHFLI